MALAGFVPEPKSLTLPQVCALYQAGLYDMRDYAIWAAGYKRQNSVVAWGLLDNQVWVPFPSQTYFNGNSSGSIAVITKYRVTDGFCWVRSRQIQSDLTTVFAPQRIPYWHQPTDPNQLPPVVPIAPGDPNAVILRIETRILADPNSAEEWGGMLNLLKAERR